MNLGAGTALGPFSPYVYATNWYLLPDALYFSLSGTESV